MTNTWPREPEWVSWTYVGAWTVALLATLPLAPRALQIIERVTGKWIAAAVVVVLIGLFVAVILRHLVRTHKTSIARAVWLITSAALVVATAATSETPIEGLHFVQYGVLGALAFRALSNRMQDARIYFGAAIIAGIVGTIDEAIQWLLPNRFWDVRDIVLNFSGAVLGQIIIAQVLRPAPIAARLSPSSVRLLSRLSVIAVALVSASLLNTPERIARYTSKVPALAVLLQDATVMAEYGFMYEGPQAGRFRSRLSEIDLRRMDVLLGPQIGSELDTLRADGGYGRFLQRYTTSRSPLAHEAANHLARRIQHRRRANGFAASSDAAVREFTIAYRENEIIERYFPVTLKHSTFRWSDSEKTRYRRAH